MGAKIIQTITVMTQRGRSQNMNSSPSNRRMLCRT